jgi:hypothetical protein
MSDDAIDLHAAVIHNSPSDIASWPATTLIERLTMRPGQNNGLSFTFGGNQTWPDYVPPGWTGPIQYTVWAGVQIRGEWHVAGFIQMWRTRPSTGAPILAQWGDWAYDRNRWGNMVDYRPQAGDKMIFFLSAGNARKGSAGPEPDVTSVRERSNVVMVTLPAGDDGTFTFATAPVVATTQSPLSPTTHAIDLDIVLEEIHKLDAKIQILIDAVSALRSSVA